MPLDQLGSNRRSICRSRSAADRDDRGWTPLHIGARKGDIKEVNILLLDIGNVILWFSKLSLNAIMDL
ncbi:unnamed protein product [Ilex paraguariensis]|uniref:ANK_REP_REGION domain-containing protein n=1 Tax=Ilex paraguariensis TaxID=185542 RepID=A0ABC8SCP1_9AQUA